MNDGGIARLQPNTRLLLLPSAQLEPTKCPPSSILFDQHIKKRRPACQRQPSGELPASPPWNPAALRDRKVRDHLGICARVRWPGRQRTRQGLYKIDELPLRLRHEVEDAWERPEIYQLEVEGLGARTDVLQGANHVPAQLFDAGKRVENRNVRRHPASRRWIEAHPARVDQLISGNGHNCG